jgi:hypothetical protein
VFPKLVLQNVPAVHKIISFLSEKDLALPKLQIVILLVMMILENVSNVLLVLALVLQASSVSKLSLVAFFIIILENVFQALSANPTMGSFVQHAKIPQVLQ